MKVLFYRYNSICEPAFIRELTAAGVTVVEDTYEMTTKDSTGLDLVNRISATLSADRYLFVMSINFFPALSAVCNIYKIPYISFIVDCPVWELYSNEICNPFNRIFVFDKVQYNTIHHRNPDCIFHLPLSADTVTFTNAITSATPTMIEKFSCDISLIGSLYSEKCGYNKPNHFSSYSKGYIDGIVKASTGLYGINTIYQSLDDAIVSRLLQEEHLYTFPEGYLADYKAIIADELIGTKVSEQDRITILKALSEDYGFKVDLYTGSDTSLLPKVQNKGFAKSLTEMPIIFNTSKINLNITTKTIKSGISQRVFDVLACGGFLISNYQEELYEFFTPGEDLEIFSSIEELADKIQYYLTHEDERLRIARCGNQTVNKYHNTGIRLQQILAKV